MAKLRTGPSGSRAAAERRIVRKQEQLAKLEERLGELMTKRADLEEELAELIRRRNATLPQNQPGAGAPDC